MPQAYLLYLASRARTQGPTRCCTDEPATDATSSQAFGRRTRKLVRAVPLTLRTFRRSLRAPLRGTAPRRGARVVTADGGAVGRVREGVVFLDSGDTVVAVTPTHPGATVGAVFLLPSKALHTREDGVVVLDAAATRLVA